MAVQLNHLIVMARNQVESARFFTEILGLPAATRFGPFLVVQTANGVSLDFDEAEGDVTPLHYAFLISEAEFDEIFGRIPPDPKPGPSDGCRRVRCSEQTPILGRSCLSNAHSQPGRRKPAWLRPSRP